MRRSYIPLILLLCFASHASAQERYTLSPDAPKWVPVARKPPPTSLFEPDSKLRFLGVSLAVGLPDGIAAGVSFHPWTNLVHIDLSLAGALSFGFRAGVTVDPFDWVVSPTLTLSGGYLGWADLPGVSRPIRFETSYLSVQPGIEVGRRSRFRLFLRAGYSHLWVDTDYWPSVSGNQATSSTKVQINLLPSLSIGVTAFL